MARGGKEIEARTVAVVGGGPAGLAAALALSERGYRPVVFEKDASPGGRARADEEDGWRFDRGAEFLASFYPSALGLVRRLGLSKTLRRIPIEGDISIRGAVHRLPADPVSFLASQLLSWRTKRRLVALTFRAFLGHTRLRWGRLEEGADLDDEDAARFFEEEAGRDYVENILGPTLESLTLSPAGETSRVLALAQIREAPGAKLFCSAGGLGAVWEALAHRIDFRSRAEAVSIARAGDGVVVAFSDGSRFAAAAAVVAVPAPDAARLVPQDSPGRADALAARYSPAVKLHIRLEAPCARHRPIAPAGKGPHALAGIGILEAKGTGQVPAGRGGMNICASPALSREMLDQTDERAAGRLLAEAERLLGAPIRGILGTRVVRLPEGVPLFYPGWIRRLAELRRALGPAPIALAGDYFASPSVDGAVRSGETAAALVGAWLDRRPA